MTFWTGLLIGLLICAVDGHILRMLTLKKGEKTRWFVAGAAVVIYSIAAIATCVQFAVEGVLIGPAIAVVFPIVGITTIIFNRSTSVDAFQIVLGIPQVAGMIIAALILFGVI